MVAKLRQITSTIGLASRYLLATGKVYWTVDLGFCATHGLWGRSPADVLVSRFYKRALNLWRKGCIRKAVFYLGAVTHLLQDICEPHHARCSCGVGHHLYEKWFRNIRITIRYSKGVFIGNTMIR